MRSLAARCSATLTSSGRRTHTRRAVTVSVVAAALSLSVLVAPANAAPQVFNVTSTQCTGPGSFTEAVDRANQNPGEDTIEFLTDVNFATCPLPQFPYMAATATESLIIKGNGHTVDGRQSWIGTSGVVNPAGVCPRDEPGTIITGVAPGLIAAGTYRTDNTGINVTVGDIKLRNMSSIAWAMENSAFALQDADIRYIDNILQDCDQPPLTANSGADVTLRRTTIVQTNTPNVRALEGTTTVGVIANDPASPAELLIEDSDFTLNSSGAAVLWNGPGNIVSSRFNNSGGIQVSGGTVKVVNSAWDLGVSNNRPWSRMAAVGNTSRLELQASSAFWSFPYCNNPVTC
jgi:hypothetical protein